MLKPAYRSFVSIAFRSRASLVISLCLLIEALALAVIPITRGERIAGTQSATAPAASHSGSFLKPAGPGKRSASAAAAGAMLEPTAASACVAPGIVVQTDGSGDEVGDPTTSQLDLTSVSIAEPYTAADDQSITFTVKVNNLTGGPQTNSTWAVYMNVNDTQGTARTMFVDMNTVDSGTGTVGYNYGYDSGNNTTSQGAGSVITGSFNEDGTIILKLSTASILSFNDITGAHQFDIDLRGAGKQLTSIQGSTHVFVGALGDGGSLTTDTTDAGTGTYTTVGNASCNAGGNPTPTPSATPTATPISTPPPTGNTPQYTNYYAPDGVADSWGEPSIGANWITGKVMFFGGLNDYALRVGFNDSVSPSTATWDQTPLFSDTLPRIIGGDPILVTDKDTGRTFVSQLQGLTPTATLDITDDDGATYTPTAGFGFGSGIDHQTIGVGPFHAPLPSGAVYQNAVYYCSQEGINSSGTGAANCALSVNGGLSFGPAVPVYAFSALNGCSPLHGHAKIAPDGTVYLPNRQCGNGAGMVLSEDNGITWQVRTVPGSSAGSSDASVGIATDGTVFLGYQGADGHARIAVSHDKGLTWINHTDVGAPVGVNDAIFPAVVAGDGGVDTARAAFAFYGTSTSGDQDQPGFTGAWYLYIASTFDGGRTWTTVNATPGDPMQRDGICTRGFQGCAVPRNLLDFFDATIDKEGRVLVGYEDGCMGSCVQAGPNSNTEKGVIARQSAGKRMFAAYDPNPNPTPTPTPTPSSTPTPTPTPTPTATPTPTPTPGAPPPSATFGHNTLADFSAVGGEPFIRVDKQDNIFVSSPFGFSTTVSLLWKSSDHGRTFIPLGTPIVRDAVTGPGGGDTHMDFDDQNRLYYVDLSAACTTAAVSEDGGNTFPLDRNNPLTCIGGGDDPEGATDDRQWVAAFGDGIAYSTVRNLAVAVGSGNFHMSKTTDAGKTWTGQIIGNVGQSGPLQLDKTKRKISVNGTEKDAILLYQIYFSGSTLKLIRIADTNDGSPFIIKDLTIPTGGGGVATVFPVLSIDKAGNLYAVWSNGNTIKLAASTDRGEHWTAPAVVNPPDMTGMNIMPWIVAGDPGRVDIIWYHTFGGNDTNSKWDIHMAQTLDALSGNPAFTTNKVNENTIHTGEICLAGLNCDISTLTGEPRDRSFAEFPSIDIDSQGAAYITYNDSTNQLPAPYVMVARQTGGASLFNSVSSLTPAGGTVTISAPASGDTIRTTSMTLSGTQTLTPKNFDRDDAADAKFPDHGAVIGGNIPALDLKSVSLSDDATSVTVTMQLADLSTTALASAPTLSGGDGVLYLTQMHSGNNVYWVGAEVRGGVARYLTGALGSINSSTSKKYITYNPDAANSMSVQGSINAAAPGTITMKIPKSLLGNPAVGTVFTSITGYAMSERGPLAPSAGTTAPDPTSLPIMADASGAATYTIGDGAPQFNGVVEVSIDDPNFTAPQTANVGDPVNANTWSLQLSGAQLVPGAHTAYVRQRISGLAASPVVSVSYTISATIEQSVTSMVSLATANARSSLGVSQYDISVKNTSTATIYAPMRIEVASITSASGRVSVANADNGKNGAGAAWDYSTKLGTDNALTSNEISLPRTLKFNNPNNEAFTVTFNVIGNLDRAAAGSTSSSSSTGGGGSGGTASSGTSPTAMLYSLVYNPLLNTITSQLIKP